MKKLKSTSIDKIKGRVLPRICSRADLEVNIPAYMRIASLGPNPPYDVPAPHLGVALTTDIRAHCDFVSQREIESLKTSFSELLAVAVENLRQRQVRPRYEGGLYSFESDEIRASNHILLTDTLRGLDVDGDLILQVGSDESLSACGSNDEDALNRMAYKTKAGIQSKGAISAFAFRLISGRLETWLPRSDHPSFRIFRELEIASLNHAYDARLRTATADGRQRPADHMRVYSSETGDPLTTCTLQEGQPMLFPKTDTVVFSRRGFLGFAYWHELREIADDLIAIENVYPECWSVGATESVELFDRVEGRLHPMAEIPVNPN